MTERRLKINQWKKAIEKINKGSAPTLALSPEKPKKKCAKKEVVKENHTVRASVDLPASLCKVGNTSGSLEPVDLTDGSVHDSDSIQIRHSIDLDLNTPGLLDATSSQGPE